MSTTIITLVLSLHVAAPTSKVDEVVVFTDRAEVTRTMKAPCKSGKAVAAFENLPATLDARTLRSDPSDGSRALGVTSELKTKTESVDERVKKLEKEMQSNADAITQLDEDFRALTAEAQRLVSYRAIFGQVLTEGIRNPRPQTAAWGRALDGFAAQYKRLDGQRLDKEKKRTELARAQQLLQRKLARLGAGRAKTFRNANVTIDCGNRQQVRASLSYVLPGATWRPEYDLDFTPNRGKIGRGKVRLTVGAVVRQNTGEDWGNVKLRLSTSKPTLGTEAPQPRPAFVTAYERKTGKVLVEGFERRESLKAGGEKEQQQQAADIEDNGNTFVLALPHRVTIISDGRPSWSPVAVLTTKGTGKLVATPKKDQLVYHAVQLDNPAKYPLLAGPIRSYRKGSFVGKSHLRYRGVGEPMEVSLGADESIRVERRVIDKTDKSAGFLSSTKHLARAYEIELYSQDRFKTAVEIRENIPVSKIEDVKVELIAAGMTKGYKLDAERGFLTWTLAIGTGERKKVRLAYEIHLPEDWKVPGR